MKNKAIIIVVLCIVVVVGIFLFANKPASQNGTYADIPSIEAGPDYGKDFKTYTSPLGYSFKYPPYMRIIEDPDEPRVYAVYDEGAEKPFSAIVVSAGNNDEKMTPEQWLLSENSGYLQNKSYYGDYHKTKVDGQDAVDTQGGMWFIVNMPDQKTRLSITYVTQDGGDVPFSQMGIVMESLAFKQK